MAKNRNAASQRANKLRNNKIGILQCSTVGCENEFYVALPGVPSRRECRPCQITKAHRERQQNQLEVLLGKLGLI